MITVYYKISRGRMGEFIVEYWRKEDRSDVISEKFVVFDEERIRFRYNLVTGTTRFNLVQVYDVKKKAA